MPEKSLDLAVLLRLSPIIDLQFFVGGHVNWHRPDGDVQLLKIKRESLLPFVLVLHIFSLYSQV